MLAVVFIAIVISRVESISNAAKFRSSQVTSEPEPEVKLNLNITQESCADGLGYVILVSDGNKRPVLEVCFNTSSKVTHYTKHIIHKDRNIHLNTRSHIEFRVGSESLYNSFNPATLYSKATQKSSLTTAIGEEAASSVLNTSYLTKGQLAPDGDFRKNRKELTYLYMNTVPQFKNFREDYWSELEQSIREFARENPNPITVITGTHETLTLPNENLVPNDVYLESGENKIPVPQFIWKMLYDPFQKKGIAFVGKNHYDDDAKVTWPCDDVCISHRWDSSSWDKSIICCEMDTFQETVGTYRRLDVDQSLRGGMGIVRNFLYRVEAVFLRAWGGVTNLFS